jgi:hypothetical protein
MLLNWERVRLVFGSFNPAVWPVQIVKPTHFSIFRGMAVKAVQHYAPGVQVPIRLPARLPQRFQKEHPLAVVTQKLLLAIPSIHPLINRPRTPEA